MVTLAHSVLGHAALDNKGTEFALSFLPNTLGGARADQVQLHIATDAPASVTVQYPMGPSPTFDVTEAVVPGTITVVTLPLGAANAWSPNAVQENMVSVTSDVEVTVYMINRRGASSDAALALPVDTMNTEYLVSGYNPRFVGSQFAVYAAFNNTNVTITPTNNIVGHSAGVPFTINLDRGEGYYALSTSTSASGNLIGSEIVSDRPVGVINGNGCTQVPTGTAACDHIFEVAQPVQSWGLTAVAANLPNRPNGTIYRVLASENNTIVNRNGSAIATLDRGEFFETASLTGNQFFEANKPIFVTQYMTGILSPGAIQGDPAMGNMIPPAQYLNSYTFSTLGGGQFSQQFLTVIAEGSDVGSLLLDGAAIPASEYTAVPGVDLFSAVVPLSEGTHETSSNGVHGITVEGFDNADSYIFPGGALFQFINPTGDPFNPVCSISGVDGVFSGLATDDTPSEDVNNDGVLDPSEDLNNNGVIDADTGIFFVELLTGAVNLSFSVDPFTPGDDSATFSLSVIDTNSDASGVVQVTDGAGRTCTEEVNYSIAPALVCDVDNNNVVDINDVRAVFAAVPSAASGPNDPADWDGDGQITVLDARGCLLESRK